MAKKVSNLVSIALMVLGLGLLFWAYQLSGSLTSQITQVVTGANSDKEMLLYLGGAVSFLTGFFLMIQKRF